MSALPRKCLARALLVALLAAGWISGCGSGPNLNDSNAIPTLTPTADVNGYQSIAPQSCLRGSWDTIQTNESQGDLLAWQPGEHRLAYLAPYATTTWYTGLLALASADRNPPDQNPGESFSTREVLLENILAAGDLTWSPDGAKLAFVAFRVDEGLESVLVLTPGAGAPLDLFPLDTARTDARTSQKSILNWLDSQRVRVLASCGEDCQQQIDIDTESGSATPASASQRKNAAEALDRGGVKVIDGLGLSASILEYDPQLFPRGFSSPNWSPDNSLVTYLDRRGLLWLLRLEDKTQWVVDVGLRVVYETKWSSDSRFVAVRAEDQISVFEAVCSQP